MYERFTEEARKVMQMANQETVRLSHAFIAPEHIALGLIKSGPLRPSALADIDVRRLRLEIEKILPPPDPKAATGSPKRPMTRSAKYVIEYAMLEAARTDSHVEPKHLLLGILHEVDSRLADVLRKLGLKFEMASTSESAPPEPVTSIENPFAADEHVRRALILCWSSLPSQRQTAEELQSQIRRLVDRALRDFQEDLEQFGIGGSEF